MTYAAWEPRHRVTTIQPGKLDLFVATFINGRRAALQPVTDYDQALATARAFQHGPKCQVKVLPLTGEEARNMGLTTAAATPEPMQPADLKLIRDTLVRVACESSDEDARRDAFDLLNELGVMKS